MSLTQAETVFAGVQELGINDLLRAFFLARPRYLHYGTPAFVPTTTVNATSIPAVMFPGVPGGIHFALHFSIPTVDVHPDNSGGAAPLVPGPGQFTIKTMVEIVVQCGTRRPNDDRPPSGPILNVKLDVVGLCAPVVISSAPGTGEIGIQLDKIEITDIKPDELESIVECVLLMVLQAVLANVRLPFNVWTTGAFGLILLAGPLAEQDQIKVRGNAL
jgi:hypothetical protein